MATVITDSKHYSDIAAAIRSKNENDIHYKPSEMAAAITAIEAGGASIDTCNIVINCFKNIEYLAYNQFVDGAVKPVTLEYSSTMNLENVICGSAIIFYNAYSFNGFIFSHDSKLIGSQTFHMWVVSAPTESVDATITIYDDD